MESIKAAVSLAETGVTQAVAQIGRLGNRSAVAQASVCAPPPPALAQTRTSDTEPVTDGGTNRADGSDLRDDSDSRVSQCKLLPVS